MTKLLTTNHKLEKMVEGWHIGGLQLAPHKLSGFNVCPAASTATTPKNLDTVIDVLSCGGHVSVPFLGERICPETWMGDPATDGDADDLWFLRPEKVHMLRFKGAHKMASRGCSAYCISTTNNGRFMPVQQARLWRTRMLYEHREWFMATLAENIDERKQTAELNDHKLAVRCNVFSDIPWEAKPFWPTPKGSLFDLFPDVTFYDYTKLSKRMYRFLRAEMPDNYHLCFSANWVEDFRNTTTEGKRK